MFYVGQAARVQLRRCAPAACLPGAPRPPPAVRPDTTPARRAVVGCTSIADATDAVESAEEEFDILLCEVRQPPRCSLAVSPRRSCAPMALRTATQLVAHLSRALSAMP